MAVTKNNKENRDRWQGTAERRLSVQGAGKSVGLRSILKVRIILLDFAN